MSLRLDPFLFTSFQSLCELGANDIHPAETFGGNLFSMYMDETHSVQNENESNGAPFMKTPLQPFEMKGMSISPGSTLPRKDQRSLPFETPGLTPISVNKSSAQTPNINVLHQARRVASMQYYPSSPESTPLLSSEPISSLNLHGLKSKAETRESNVAYRTTTGRSLFRLDESENSEGRASTSFGRPKKLVRENGIDETKCSIESERVANTRDGDARMKLSTNDVAVTDILNLLTISGSMYQSLCQYRCKEALQFLQMLPAHQQVTPWTLQQQGRAFLELGDFHAAQRSLEYMHKVDPCRMEGLELLSTVYWQLKKEMELANLAQIALDWDILSPEAHCVVGNCFSLQKEHETALMFFKRSLQLDPNFTYTHTLSGYEYMSNEDFDRAICCFRQALRIDERHYNAWYGLGAIYHKQEKFDLAEYHFEKAVSLHPSSSVLRCNLGMSQFANGKAYQALDTLAEAYRLDPRNPQAGFQRSAIYSALHRPEEALAELKAVCNAAPCEATVHFAMGKVLKRLRRPDEAMRCFLTAMDLDPKDSQLIKSAMDKLDEPDVDEEAMTAF